MNNIQELSMAIKQIYSLLGQEMFMDSKKFNALLSDFAPQLHFERNVFQKGMSDELLKKLSFFSNSQKEGIYIQIKRIENVMEDEFGLAPKWTKVILGGFSDAFEITDYVVEYTKETLVENNDTIVEKITETGSKTSHNNDDVPEEIVEEKIIPYEIRLYATSDNFQNRYITGNSFTSHDTTYLTIDVFFKPVKTIKQATMKWRVYRANGSVFLTPDDLNANISENSGSLYASWGWGEPGNWPAGKYYVLASINDSEYIRGDFEIISHQYDRNPAKIKKVDIFESGDEVKNEPDLPGAVTFYSETTRRLYFRVYYSLSGFFKKNAYTTINYKITDSSGNLLANFANPINLQSDWDRCWTAGWGWSTPCNWKPGRYKYEVSFGWMQPVTGEFTIK